LNALDESRLKRPTLLADGDTFYTCDIVGAFRQVSSTHNAVFCFHDTQPKPIYSYITLDDQENILEVKEKIKISDWANSGCYCFRDGAQLAKECEALIEANTKQASQDGVGEFYTSGVIAEMIKRSEPFRALKLDVGDMHVLGTPTQVEAFCASWKVQPRQRFVFDLEGVLIVGHKGDPITRNIEKCQQLKKQGHTIIIQSTRGEDMEKKTWRFLEQLKVPCDELRLGKPRGEFYVGGPNSIDGILGDLDKQIGFYPTDVAATRVRGSNLASAKGNERPLRKARITKVSKLNPDSKGVTCLVKIVSAAKTVDPKREGGPKFFEFTCGDESGKVILSLTDAQQADVHEDKVVCVRNGSIKMVGSHMRLVVDKWGKLDLNTDENIDKVGDDNRSATEYELHR